MLYLVLIVLYDLRGVEKLDDARSAKIIGFDDEENEY